MNKNCKIDINKKNKKTTRRIVMINFNITSNIIANNYAKSSYSSFSYESSIYSYFYKAIH